MSMAFDHATFHHLSRWNHWKLTCKKLKSIYNIVKTCIIYANYTDIKFVPIVQSFQVPYVVVHFLDTLIYIKTQHSLPTVTTPCLPRSSIVITAFSPFRSTASFTVGSVEHFRGTDRFLKKWSRELAYCHLSMCFVWSTDRITCTGCLDC